ncbi:hypothetical protein EIP91_003062 [Steccherinum ochraceum]|uniref:DUF6533 domain-containing protein n=1 Tax=Steccherinum ochraceum TaxID=92696 RepID=A0A4R0RB17_9APHY|nr:hypothetical protein EIP91_003062 [Steccherinum ochraceum]
MATETISFGRACAVLGLCLVAYDVLATLEREIEFIWKRPFGVITVLFVTQRWLVVIGGLMFVQIPSNDTVRVSPFSTLRINSHFLLGMLGLEYSFATLRIWAIYNHAIVPTVLIFLVSVTKPVLCILTVEDEVLHNAPALKPDSAVVIICRMLTVVSDFVILFSTWVKTANTWRHSFRMKGFTPVLSTLLLRDGTLYFGGLFILNFGGSILRIFRVDDLGGLGYCFATTAISTNLIARFILDLRGAYDDDSRNAGTMSSIQFETPSFAVEMGASLGTRFFESESAVALDGYRDEPEALEKVPSHLEIRERKDHLLEARTPGIE